MSFVRRRMSALFEGLLASLVIAGLAAALGLAAFTIAAPGVPNGQQSREGVLSIRHGDDLTSGRISGHSYFLEADGTETELVFEGAPPEHSMSGRRIRVDGKFHGPRFLVAAGGTQQAGGPSAPTTGASGAKTVAVVLLNFSNDRTEPYTAGYAEGVAFTNADSVAAYYAETSWGQLTLTGDVLGWYPTPDTNDTCAVSTWAASASAAAAADGVSLASYDHVVYAFPYTNSCAWSGLASMPGRSSWLNGPSAMRLRTMAHELGHNFGTHHSSSLNCTESGARVALSATCAANEYGDPFSVMGSADHYQHTNFSRGNFGWLANANTLTVTSGGTYTIRPIEGVDTTGVQVIRIPRGSTGTYLTLEFRQPSGVSFDTFSSVDPVINGVTVRLAADYTAARQSQLIDATPTTSGFADAPLAVGQSLGDPASGVVITTLSVSASGATVQVAFGALPPAPTPSPSATAAPTVPPPTPVPTATPIPTTDPTTSPVPTAGPDSEAPTKPGGLRATVGKGKKVTLSWNASSDNLAVAGYRLFRDGVLVTSTSGTSFTDAPPGRNTMRTYYVVAFDSAGNSSPASEGVSITP